MRFKYVERFDTAREYSATVNGYLFVIRLVTQNGTIDPVFHYLSDCIELNGKLFKISGGPVKQTRRVYDKQDEFEQDNGRISFKAKLFTQIAVENELKKGSVQAGLKLDI